MNSVLRNVYGLIYEILEANCLSSARVENESMGKVYIRTWCELGTKMSGCRR